MALIAPRSNHSLRLLPEISQGALLATNPRNKSRQQGFALNMEKEERNNSREITPNRYVGEQNEGAETSVFGDVG